jgi:hypothetical protein
VSRSARDAQHLFPLQLAERRCSLAMLGLGLTKQVLERSLPAEWVEPGILGHGWKTEEAALDYPLEELECGLHLLTERADFNELFQVLMGETAVSRL